MKKGISPIVAVVLLIAIAVIAAVGLYFWVGGLATKQPTPNTPGTITATCTSGTLTVTNIGANSLEDTELTMTGGATNSSGGTTCTIGTLESGETVVCATNVTSGTSGTVYGATTGAAQYSC